MRKPPTGEPCAGEPHARFGGRGGATLPDPYHIEIITRMARLQITYYVALKSNKFFNAILSSDLHLLTIYKSNSITMLLLLLFGLYQRL